MRSALRGWRASGRRGDGVDRGVSIMASRLECVYGPACLVSSVSVSVCLGLDGKYVYTICIADAAACLALHSSHLIFRVKK